MPDRVCLGPSDDELLERLAAALAPLDVPSPESGLAALRTALEARTTWPAGTPARTIKERWRSWTGRSRRGLAALGLIGAVWAGGTSAAFARSASLPEPVRAVVHHLGLAVGSPSRPSTRHPGTSLRRDPASSATVPTRTAARVRASGTPGAQRTYPDASDQQKAGTAPLQHSTAAPSLGSGRSLLPSTDPDALSSRRQPGTPATNALCSSACASGRGQPPGSVTQYPSTEYPSTEYPSSEYPSSEYPDAGYPDAGYPSRSASADYPTGYPSDLPSSPGPGGRAAQTTDGGGG
jgi:hypothetical protein